MAASLAVLPDVRWGKRPGPWKRQRFTLSRVEGCIILMPLHDELMSQRLMTIRSQ